MAPGATDEGTAGSTGRRVRDLALVFLKLGTTAFGGPAAHIAMMEQEVVRRRRWLSREEFLDYLGATHLIPGPNSTELAIHIGHVRAGWPGLLVAGACFIVPAALMVTAIAWGYVRYGRLPEAAGILYGVKPVVLGVVFHALGGLARTALKSRILLGIGAGATLAAAVGVNELVVLAGAMVAASLAHVVGRYGQLSAFPMVPVERSLDTAALGLAVAGVASVPAPFSLWALFGMFFKVGAVLFGSGYVLLAFLRADLVERLGWLTEQQLLDAVAVGQVTPGPVFTTATFVGYLLGGPAGATVATIAIFLPAFFFVAISGPLIPRLRRSPLAGAVLDGIVVASLALMAVVTWHLGRAALLDVITLGLAVLTVLLLIRYHVNSAWLVLAGGAAGFLVHR